MLILTGGAGFIGSCLLKALNVRGHSDILVVDHLGSDEKWKNLQHKKFTEYFDRADFIGKISAKQIDPKSVDAIFHLGACSSTLETDAHFLMENNYRYTKTLAKWAVENNIRFIYASSAATYGNGEFGYSDDLSLLSKLHPLNMYGFSKHLFDEWALQSNLFSKIAGFKFFNVFGANEYHKGEMRSLIHKAFFQVQKDSTLRLFKSYRDDYRDGEQMRDFIYVNDVVEMLLYTFENPKVVGLFNMGSGRAITWNTLADSVFRAMQKKPRIEYIEMPLELRDRYQYYTQAEMEKFRATGFTKTFAPTEEAVQIYVREYLQANRYV